MALPQLNDKQKFSYADYLTWPDDERWELIDGVAYPWNGISAMSPAPNLNHQRVIGRLFRKIGDFLDGKPCEAFVAPVDVRFSENRDAADNYVDTVVQPDILVVCDRAKLDERGCHGAPDLIVEILSPATASRDLKQKYELYQRYGVKEYWIVHPNDQTVLVFKLGEDGMYGRAAMYTASDVVPVPLLGDLTIDLNEVFAE
jgi:Uma2 family endonuclease